jgi:hypothetical protein
LGSLGAVINGPSCVVGWFGLGLFQKQFGLAWFGLGLSHQQFGFLFWLRTVT